MTDENRKIILDEMTKQAKVDAHYGRMSITELQKHLMVITGLKRSEVTPVMLEWQEGICE